MVYRHQRFRCVPIRGTRNRGLYAIEASIAGFKTFESRADLSAAHIATVNIKLDVGGESETVQVSAQAAALETASRNCRERDHPADDFQFAGLE